MSTHAPRDTIALIFAPANNRRGRSKQEAKPTLVADLNGKIGANGARAKAEPSLETLDPRPAAGSLPPFRIDREGAWYYRGTIIPRPALVQLFSTILQRDGDGRHWLRTPVEAVEVAVEDAPFLLVELHQEGSGETQALHFRDTLDRWVTLDAAHPLILRGDVQATESSGPRPYIALDKGLEARIARAVFYQLAEIAVPGPSAMASRDGQQGEVLGLWSCNRFFPLAAA